MGWLATVRRIGTLVAATLAVAAPAQAVELDDDGWALTDFPSPWYWHSSAATDVTVQPDGRIVLAGGTSVYDEDLGDYSAAIALARFNPDFSLDSSFSQDGRQTTEVGDTGSAYGSAVMLQADGKIVVAGGSDSDFLLARYRADGSLDTSFADGGVVTTDLGGFDRTHAAAMQPDGKFVVVGESDGLVAVARYRADGSHDSSFGGDGAVTTDVHDALNGQAVAIQGDGKIVVGGGHHLVRYQPDGSLDASFGTGGVVDQGALWIFALALQADGRIVAAGAVDGQFVLARHRSDGSLDWSFGVGGLQHTEIGFWGSTGAAVTDIAIQANGKIVAAGILSWYSIEGMAGTYMAAARYSANGSLDPTFGAGYFGSGPDQSAEALTIAPDGRVLAAGAGNTWDDGFFSPQRFLLASLGSEPSIVTTITGGPTSTSSDTAPTFTFTAQEPGSTFECRLDGPGDATSNYTPCNSPKSYNALADGNYAFSVRGTTPAGVSDPEPPTRSFTIRTRPPESTITGGANGQFGFRTGLFLFTSEPGATFECKLDGPGAVPGSYAPCSSPYTFSVPADGGYTFSVRATKSGLIETTPATQAFTVDTVPPDVTITAGPSGTTSERTPQFAFASSGPIDHWDCALTGPGLTPVFAPCTSPRTLGPLANGSYTFMVRGTDAAWNATTATRSFTIAAAAAAAPDTTITGGPPAVTNGTAPAFTFTASIVGSTFECRLDTPSGTGIYAACNSPRTYTMTANGSYSFSVRAIGPGGMDATPATRSFRVDTVAPTTSLDSGPVGSTTDDTPTFTFSSNEPGSFECRLDTVETPGSFEPCASPLTLGPLAGGVEYALFVRAIDAAGNADPGFVHSGLFVVDGSPPDTWIDDGPSGVTNVTTPSFTFHATLGGSTFECKLDRPGGAAGSYAPCSSPQAYTTIVNGPYTLTVRATSNGRTDPSPSTRSFTVATTPGPTPTPTSTPSPTASPSPSPTASPTPSPTPSPSPSPSGCVATNGADVQIPDLSTVESPITASGCAGNASATARVEVHLLHTYIGDLIVSLIAPDGSTYVLHNRAGGSADNIDQTYTVNLSSEPANGTWRLRVQDAAGGDIGRIDSWTFSA